MTELKNNIKDNHTLIGLHLTGNEAEIDGAGYIHPFVNDLKSITSHYSTVSLEDHSQFDINNRTNCWICENWIPVELVISQVYEPVFVHVEWLDFMPW